MYNPAERRALPEGWCSITDASEILKVHVTAVNDVVVKHDVAHRKISGVRAYHIDSLKVAAVEVENMRRLRQEKRQQQQETVNG